MTIERERERETYSNCVYVVIHTGEDSLHNQVQNLIQNGRELYEHLESSMPDYSNYSPSYHHGYQTFSTWLLFKLLS